MPLVVALMTTMFMLALGGALVLITTTETLIAANYRAGVEALHAADAAIEIVLGDLAATGDWNLVLAGVVRSSFVDGAPSGVRQTASGAIDLTQLTNMLRCGRVAACQRDEIASSNELRPWGSNNPEWQLYGFGALRAFEVDSDLYAVVWAGDDPAECDADPGIDGGPCPSGENPGRDVLSLVARAYGPGGVRRAVEVTVAKTDGPRLRLLSWREVR